MSTTSYSSPLVPMLRHWPDGRVEPTGFSASLVGGNSSKSDTEKRPKPLDLFASTTAMSYTQEIRMLAMTQVVANDGSIFDGPLMFFTGGTGSWFNVDTYIDVNFNALDSRVRKRIKDSNLNLAQSLAEYRQTSSMLVSLTNDVLRTFRSLRNGRALGDFVRSLQQPRSRKELNVANRWLQYQYGVRPLMNDIYGSAEALAKKIRTGFWRYQKTSSTDEVRLTNVPYLGTYDLACSRSARLVISKRVVARYMIRDASLKQLSEVGITNPLLLAWELIPYSFVFDWIIPVGDFLSSLDSLVGVEQLQVARHRKIEQTYSNVCHVASGVNQHYYVSKHRFALDNSLLLPRLGYKPSKSLSAVANGVALLRQLRK